jgi:cytochrome c-type biogenesis protein CcmF
MFAQALNISLSIGEPYFHLTFAPMMAVLLLAMPVAPMASWRKADLTPILRSLAPAAIVAFIVAVAATVLHGGFAPWLFVGVFVGAWVVAGVLRDLLRRAGAGGVGRLFRLPLAVWGMAIAHIGIGLFVIGATTETASREERTFPLARGETAQMAGWSFRFDDVRQAEGPNYYATRANITVTHPNGAIQVIHPEKRIYPAAGTPTTEVAILKTLTGDIYVALGDTIREAPGVWRIRIARHPLIDWIFGGAGLIALGGFVSLAARIRRREKATVEEQAPASGAPKPATAGAPA